jgi:hypothetical protein
MTQRKERSMPAAPVDPLNEPEPATERSSETVVYHGPVRPPPAIASPKDGVMPVQIEREGEATVLVRRSALAGAKASPLSGEAGSPRRHQLLGGSLMAIVVGGFAAWLFSGSAGSESSSGEVDPLGSSPPSSGAPSQTTTKLEPLPSRKDEAREIRGLEGGQGRNEVRALADLTDDAPAIAPEPSPTATRSSPQRSASGARRIEPATTSGSPEAAAGAGPTLPQGAEAKGTVTEPAAGGSDEGSRPNAASSANSASSRATPSTPSEPNAPARSWLAGSKPKAWVQ